MEGPLKPVDASRSEVGSQKSPPTGRWVRAARWLAFCLVLMFVAAYAHTAVFGVRAARQAIDAEALADFRSYSARVPRNAFPGYPGTEYQASRALFPGVISCRYHVALGRRLAGSTQEAYFFWIGSSCWRHSSRVLMV